MPPAVIAIIGAGLAGSEAALQLAKRQIPLRLYDMKPVTRSAAHHQDTFAEIVCSNSLGNLQVSTASGLLKAELAGLGCELLAIAQQCSVPAGNALAVDRERFSEMVTQKLQASPYIELIAQDVTELPNDADYVVIATGPLTSPGLTESLQRLLNQSQLYFFDAAAPIVTQASIDFDKAFYQNRYDKGQESAPTEGSYINCPLNQAEYEALIQHLLSAEKIPLKDFETQSASFFESCLPIEELARRGHDTPRYGPMKPVGLVDPRTGKSPYAAIQLRQDNQEGTLYNLVGFQTNLKWGAQKEMMALIPGLENAEVVRYGVMHRNTYLNSPQVLTPTLQLKAHPNLLIAGQLSGVEGYTECIASGLVAALSLSQLIQEKNGVELPKATMLGALLAYITRPDAPSFQPINSNWGILPPLATRIRDKKGRNEALAQQAEAALKQFTAANPELGLQPPLSLASAVGLPHG